MKRHILSFALMLAISLFGLQALAAQPKHEAGKLVDQVTGQIIKHLLNPEIKSPGPTQDKLLDEVQKLIYTHFDFEEFSARTIGAKWREFNQEQRKEFEGALGDLLYYTYLGTLLKYTGQPIEYVGEIVSSKGDKVEVRTNFIWKNEPIPVNYRMLNKKSGWRVYDIYVENISMVQNYRGQFQQILQKQTPEELVKMIQSKAEETKANANATLRASKS